MCVCVCVCVCVCIHKVPLHQCLLRVVARLSDREGLPNLRKKKKKYIGFPSTRAFCASIRDFATEIAGQVRVRVRG